MTRTAKARAMWGAAEVLGARVAAAGPGDSHGQERDPDNRDDGADHDGRKEAKESAEVGADQKRDDPRDYDGAVDGGEPPRLSDQDHRGNRREGHTLDDRQPEALPPEAYGLDQGRHPARKEIGVDQIHELLPREPYGVRQDERNRYGPGVHREDVLEPEQGEPPGRQHLVHGVRGSPRPRLLDPLPGHLPSP